MTNLRCMLIAIVLLLVFHCEHSARGQNGLTEEEIERLFGDLSRPADILLAEAEANVAKAALARRLQNYLEYRANLNELHSSKFDISQGESAVAADRADIASRVKRFESDLKQTESEIRDLSRKLNTSGLLPVHTGIDDQQAVTILRNAQVLVTITSKSGEVLSPSKLTLNSPAELAVGFAEIRPGVYLAGGLAAGDYQLAWQLTPKSTVQRIPKVTVVGHGCVVCEVVLGIPEPKCTTKVVESIVLPHRSPARQQFNISGHKPVLGNGSSAELQPPNDMPLQPVASHNVAKSKSDSTTPAFTTDEVKSPKVVAREALLELSILWDEECLFNDDLFGLRFQTLTGDRVMFFVRRENAETDSKRPVLSAVVELHYQNGKLHGKVRRWAEDGTLLVEVPYRNGLIDGESRFFNRKGQLLGTSVLVRGTGIYRIWDRSKDEQVLIKEIEYVDGQERPKQ